MGVILSRFRKKKSTLEILESLESKIKSIQEYGQNTEQRHKAVVGRLVVFSVGLYALAAFLFYYFFFPASLYHQFLYVVPLLIFPVIMLLVKRLVSWWYRRKISRNQEKLQDMQKQKKELLEEVMDKETYKVARQILEKFAPDQLHRTATTVVSSSTSGNNLGTPSNAKASSQLLPIGQSASFQSAVRSRPGIELRRRPGANQQLAPGSPGNRLPISQAGSSTHISPTFSGEVVQSESSPVINTVPVSPSVTSTSSTAGAAGVSAIGTASGADEVPPVDDVADEKKEECEEGERTGLPGLSVPQGPQIPLPRPILSQDRTVMDRLVEFLVGDGLNHRYALVCRQCNSHNGMALQEEFEYLAFRCCYCFHWNPARKQRLQSPRLEALPVSRSSSTTGPDSNTDEEEDPKDQPPKTAVKQGSKERGVEELDVEEQEFPALLRKMSTSSSEEIRNILRADPVDTSSSTDAESESQVPGPISQIQPAARDSEAL